MRKIAQMELIQSADDRAVSLLLINTELNGAVDTHWFWRCALVEFQHLQRVRQRFADNISRGSPLPAKFDNVLGALEILLVNEINKRSLQLLGLISQQPGFRHLYHHDVARPGPNGTFTSSVRMKPFIPPSGDLSKQAKDAYAYRTEKIWVILTELLGEADFQERFRYDTMLDVLGDYLATCTRDERAILGENLYEALSEYIVLVELLWTIRVHWPRNTNRTLSDCEKTEDRIAWRAKPYYHLARQTASMIAALHIFQTSRPPSGNRGHNWLKKFDLLHGNLQKYWSNVSGAYRDAYRKMGLKHEDIELAMEPLLSWNHFEYRTRLKLKREQILADINKPRAVGGDDTFLPLYVPPNTSETSKTVSKLIPKVKVKTRGAPQAQDPVTVDQVLQELKLDHPTLHVSKRSYAALRCIFPATIEDRQKNLDWNTFVDSMIEAGFAAQNRGGSMVGFEHSGGKGAIVFHRPHPEPILDPIMLHGVGSRMNKHFGWVRETFVLAKKGGE